MKNHEKCFQFLALFVFGLVKVERVPFNSFTSDICDMFNGSEMIGLFSSTGQYAGVCAAYK